ncbi:MAG: AraC family transcriptional regulator [Bacteroidota bacterium]
MVTQIDISGNILDQFAKQLNIKIENDHLRLNSTLGIGHARLWRLPNQLELHHFAITLNEPFELQSTNPAKSDWFLLNINLSDAELKKTVNTEEISFQKYLPSGILLYTPKTEVLSTSPQQVPFSIVLIRFHKSLLMQYSDQKPDVFKTFRSAVIYEDLDFQSEQLLIKSIEGKNLLFTHSHVLEFLGLFFEKIKSRRDESYYEHLHPDDLKGLFSASAFLRNPFAQDLPSVEELSKIAGMGTTKFNTTFKQVFGTTPRQYNLKIRMEYAKDQLLKKFISPSEISHRLGYSHPSKFTTAFKKQFGILPSQL